MGPYYIVDLENLKSIQSSGDVAHKLQKYFREHLKVVELEGVQLFRTRITPYLDFRALGFATRVAVHRG